MNISTASMKKERCAVSLRQLSSSFCVPESWLILNYTWTCNVRLFWTSEQHSIESNNSSIARLTIRLTITVWSLKSIFWTSSLIVDKMQADLTWDVLPHFPAVKTCTWLLTSTCDINHCIVCLPVLKFIQTILLWCYYKNYILHQRQTGVTYHPVRFNIRKAFSAMLRSNFYKFYLNTLQYRLINRKRSGDP